MGNLYGGNGVCVLGSGFGSRQTEDWFESNFILFFFAVAIAALVFAIFWEWRHPDPVVEIRLLGDRNFALANIFYFIFGFTLYGSTVLIPQMLQRLYGYTATDAGLVLGPGAFVIVMLAPVVVRILPKIGVKRLVGFGYLLFCAGHVVLREFYVEHGLPTRSVGTRVAGTGNCDIVRAGEPAGIFQFTETQKQQGFELDELVSQSRWMFWNSVCDNITGATNAIPSERTGGAFDGA